MTTKMGQDKAPKMGGYFDGMSRKNPPASDASTRPKTSASVNDEATRTSVAATPRTLGPRTA